MAVNGLSWKVALVLFVFSLSVNAKTIYDLRTNYEVAPLSVEGTPVFSWKMDTETIPRRHLSHAVYMR